MERPLIPQHTLRSVNERGRIRPERPGFQLLHRAVCFLVTLFLLFSFCSSIVSADEKKTTPKSKRYVTIDFNDVEINLFIKFISELTGENFIVDRSVKGNISIISPTKISVDDAYKLFLSVLEVHGFATIPAGAVTKIIPAVQARTKSVATILQDGALYPEDRVVTKLFQLQHADPNEVKTILAPLISNTSVVIAHTESGMLIITDVMSNLHRLTDIIDAIDIPSVDEEMSFIQLENATALTVSRTLSELFMPRGGKPKTEVVKIIPYERTNSLIILASKSTMKKVSSLVSKLDTTVPRGEGKIQVYYLQHADAEELVKVLTSLANAEKNAQPGPGAKAPLLSRNVNIMADDATNSLVITAPRDEYAVIEDVIAKLDIPRRMVYIEALIMEVKVDKSFEIGVQWGGSGSYNGDTGNVYTGFSGSQSAPYGVINGLTQGTDGSDSPIFPSGFLLGVMQEGVKIGDVFFPSLGAVLNAYKSDSDVNIIATPQILTTDNKKAEIKVGENVPYITSLNTTTSQQDYTNYEYKDVNTTLEITPQINQHNLVKLDIFTEIVKLKNPNSENYRPETLKRTAKTTVIIRDKETIVLGGIIGQDTSNGEYKVPLLGDIPLLGWLFKSHARYDQRTNLFIFITPHIVENPAEVASLYHRKRGAIDASKKKYEEKFTGWEPLPQPDAERAEALTDVGFAKLRQKDYGTAKEYFMEALHNDPKNSSAVLNMGSVYEAEGLNDKAVSMYRLVLELEGQKEKNKQSPYLSDIAQQKLEKLRILPEQE